MLQLLHAEDVHVLLLLHVIVQTDLLLLLGEQAHVRLLLQLLLLLHAVLLLALLLLLCGDCTSHTRTRCLLLLRL